MNYLACSFRFLGCVIDEKCIQFNLFYNLGVQIGIIFCLILLRNSRKFEVVHA
jgi:hypothetical protein